MFVEALERPGSRGRLPLKIHPFEVSQATFTQGLPRVRCYVPMGLAHDVAPDFWL